MISVVYCTRNSNPEHKEHLIKSSGLHKHLEVIEIINNGEDLTKSYNKGLKKSKNDIVIFCHDDIIIETKNWGQKLIKLFERNQEYGVIGVAGTKNMPVSGQWWEDRSKMYGRVAHTHEGKTWLSTYSDDLGQNIEEAVIVDGLFFAIDKTKIKTKFNESVKGFHFYEITFCFENFLKGVKIGVTTMIRVNHMSIGMTNEQWETNRAEFAEKFKENLPVNIKRTLRKGEKLNILIGCLSFANYTGSEMYVFELAKNLVKFGHNVSVCSNIGEPLAKKAKNLGIKLYTLNEPPGFKLGDGKWLLKTEQGDIVSQENTLYKLSDTKFDLIHLNHKPVTEHLLRLYPDVPVICSIHSEVISLEEPVISEQIKKYIAIRPEIKKHIIENHNISEDKIEIIYNPIDENKFKPKNNVKNNKKVILFVGTIDYLRKNTIYDLVQKTKNDNEELWLVGKNNDNYLNDIIENQPHVKYFGATYNVEEYINKCDETAGILLGRTTIEGWLCGKKGWIYDVDEQGNINSKKLHEIPKDVDKFKSTNVVNKIIDTYMLVLN
jgi:hypothetical protein